MPVAVSSYSAVLIIFKIYLKIWEFILNKTMETIWTNLPGDLVDKVCNKLKDVRRIPPELKEEIESQRYMLAKLIDRYIAYFDSNSWVAMYELMDRFGTRDITEKWMSMTPEDRMDMYTKGMYPGHL